MKPVYLSCIVFGCPHCSAPLCHPHNKCLISQIDFFVVSEIRKSHDAIHQFDKGVIRTYGIKRHSSKERKTR
ncbi:hypothetical protein Q4R00_19610, partial [Morganella morganii]